jgi:hypothetical protein
MNWQPTKPELELVADAFWARQSPEKIATALGIARRIQGMAAGLRRSCRAEETKYVKPAPVPPKPVMAAPVSPRVVADRLFGGDPAMEIG